MSNIDFDTVKLAGPAPSHYNGGEEASPSATQASARSALYGNGGFASWDRVLANAVPEN